jgi:hypothetical protein
MEFHIARSLRERLQLDEVLFSYTGNAIFANVAAARKLALGLNQLRGQTTETPQSVHGAALYAMGLIDELSHAMVAHYRETVDGAVLTEALKWFSQRMGEENLGKLLLTFAEKFPGTAVFRGELTAAEWLKLSTEGTPHRESELEELLLLWLANQNPAFLKFRELFADDELKLQTVYPNLTQALPVYFETRPPLSPEAGSLIQALQAPMLASPDSLVGQLEFIRERWAPYLGAELKRALLAIDVVREEDVAVWMQFHPNTGGLHPTHGGDGWSPEGFVGDEYVGWDDEYVTGPDGVRRPRQYASDHQAPLVEYEAFSADYAWMPTVVMMAKSTYVWLEQLSKKYQRHIHRLDQIPDEELKYLADTGMTALWLIGLWERSVASRTIKRLRGQADAVASAYSLKDYNIAEDLGGNGAYESLRDRAGAYGLRLASDMVPNHMGIDSPWVIEHPEWFITRNESPFPVYRFDGPDLSMDSRAEIKLEDHYYDQTDAAVAFRLRTYGDGQTRYMYHGNDGTTFAWNDTAQLDYSKAYVREHVMQVILHVARLFPIIRFDAAMVLAKRHVQRLWFPLPGVGGSIPSRAENAMSQEEFDALMPNEFWREVVDRVAVEVPGTLLLAEAFWLLEGYFVRTLGMHRVYNSAFMNMLRDEENAKYRSYLKKTLEFDPDILKRYVNFMSNPDEKTAAEQFGDGDKHFGTCTLLATLPGLPMFAHGQVEGFSERYGMDFKQARMEESPDQHLMERYRREITPLLKNRKLFAESTNFVLYDFWHEHGSVDENVMAYSNRLGNERAIILYNNVYQGTQGTIKTSVGSIDKGSGHLRHTTLMEALALPFDDDVLVGYRDSNAGVEYLRHGYELRDNGLTIQLHGYQYVVLQNWRELRSSAEHPWRELCDSLHGTGVPNLEEALRNLRLKPVHDALRELASPANLQSFIEAVKSVPAPVATVAPNAAAVPLKVGVAPVKAGKKAASASVAAVPAKSAKVSPAKRGSAKAPAKPTADAATQAATGTPFKAEATLFAQLESSAQWFYSEIEKIHALPELDVANVTAPTKAAAYGARLRKHAIAMSGALPEKDRTSMTKEEWATLLLRIVLEGPPELVNKTAVFDDLGLRAAVADVFATIGIWGEDSWRASARVRLLQAHGAPLHQALLTDGFWDDTDVRWLVGISEANDTTYFDRDKFAGLLMWMQKRDLLEHAAVSPLAGGNVLTPGDPLASLAGKAEEAGYKLKDFRELLQLAEVKPIAAKSAR